MGTFTIGRTRVRKVHELDLNGIAATQLLPGLDPHLPVRHPEWFAPGTYDEQGHALLSIHSWLVEHGGAVILIDTGAGADKARPGLKVLDDLHQPYLERLAQAGVTPEQVDYVLLTHIHADHVGWNTRLVDGAWTPTFPNATVICSGLEWSYSAALAAGDEAAAAHARERAGVGEPARLPTPGVFDDSLRPLAETGRLQFVEVDGREVLPGVRFVGTRGHSIDHAAIEIVSEGETGVFGGDVLHHPVEVHQPELVSMFCEFPDVARASRRRVLEQAATRGVVYFSSHFPLSSVGRVERAGEGFRWKFEDEC